MDHSTVLITWFCFAAFSLQSLLVNAACPTDWYEEGDQCYGVLYKGTKFKTASDARKLCLQHGADMAMISSQALAASVYDLISNLSLSLVPQELFIGLTDIHENGTFQWLSDNSTLKSYSPWEDGEPDDGGLNGERCVLVTSSDDAWTENTTKWNDISCCLHSMDIHLVACQKPSDSNITLSKEDDILYQHCHGDCPEGWFIFNEKCYSLQNASYILNSTYDARQMCLAEGADLPSLLSVNEEYHISNIIWSQSEIEKPGAIYLGINDVMNDTNFVLLNGNPVDDIAFVNWDKDQQATNDSENKNCVILRSHDGLWSNHSNQKWQDVHCCSPEGISWVMCEKPVDSNISIGNADDDIFAETCYKAMNECDSNPCQNGGTCEDHVLYYNCSCLYGYEGAECEIVTDYCSVELDPCVNGDCQRGLGGLGYNCTCKIGYNGTNCDNLYSYCAMDLCQNNATCTDLPDNSPTIKNLTCNCTNGFDGRYCENNINECVVNGVVDCQNGGTCRDLIAAYKCDCVHSFSGDHCEKEIICPPVTPIENATTINGTGPHGLDAQVTFTCLPGMKFSDLTREKVATCQSDDKWDLEFASYACAPHCDVFPTVENAEPDQQTTLIGTTLNFTCSIGHKFPDNSTFLNITCMTDGNWSTDITQLPGCEVVECPVLPTFEHQTLMTTNTTYNTTVIFYCDVGYVIHDNTTARSIKCKANGKWTAELPPCNPILCPIIPLIANGERNTSVNTYNTYVQYKCKKNNRMEDGAIWRVLRCDATGEWSDNVTDCAKDRCFPLPYVHNARPDTLLALNGTVSKLTCIKGHKFFPQKYPARIMECQSDGRWRPILRRCDPITCDTLDEIDNSAKSTEIVLYGTVVDYTCDKGHYFDHSIFQNVVTLECMEDETWNISTESIGTCDAVPCPDPPEITNGTRGPVPDFPVYSNSVSYDCDSGFKFIDGKTDRVLGCNEWGLWNQSDLSCRKDRCDEVPRADHTIPDTTNTSWYTNVTYTCNPGYEWPNNKTTHVVMCEVGGEWNDTNVPKCKIKYCEPVRDMVNATENTTDHHYDTYLEYGCDTGFKFYDDNSTSRMRHCDENAIWQPTIFPDCEIVYCPELIDIENATRDTNDTHYGTLATYSCDDGYQYPDRSREKTVFCTENETWTEFPPPCEVVFCPPVPDWGDVVFNGTDNEFLAVTEYWCTDGYAFRDEEGNIDENPKTSTCAENKKWDPPFEECLSKEKINADLIGVTYEAKEGPSIGALACTLMCTLLALIVLLDLNKLYADCKVMKGNVQSMLQARKKNKVSDSCSSLNGQQESTF